jgi:hypothetical protein
MLHKAAAGERLDTHEQVQRCLIVDFHGSTRWGEPLYIVRAGLSSPGPLLSQLPQPKLLEWLMYMKELAFLKCDALTREQRVLVKQVALVDLSWVTLAMATETQFQQTLGESSKLSERIYPQLLGKQVIFNPPRFMLALFSLFKAVMSPKALARLGVCPGPGDAKTISGCPFAGQRFDPHAVPSFLGGECRCVHLGGCIACVPNSCTSPPAGRPEEGAERTVTVHAGSAHDIQLPAKVPGCRLLWQLAVAEKGVELSVEVQPEVGPPVTLLEARKIRNDEGQVSGALAVPCAGTVRVRLDNSYSRFTGKKVTYTVTLVQPMALDEGNDAEGPLAGVPPGEEQPPAASE